MKFKVVISGKLECLDIRELVLDANKELANKEKEIKRLKLNPLNDYIVLSKEEEVIELKGVLSKFKYMLREERLKQLGI